MSDHARALEQQLTVQHDLVAHVKEAMKSLLKQGSATLEKVARALRMSGSTLQRKLAERDVSFASLLEELRKREAIRCLTQTAHGDRDRLRARLLRREHLRARLPRLDRADAVRVPRRARPKGDRLLLRP